MKFNYLFLLFFFIVENSPSQISLKDSLLHHRINEKISPFLKDQNLLKASKFYFEKNWDSTLIYTDKFLNSTKKNSYLNNYIHFFRGYSFKNKKLINEAEKNFSFISRDFEFFHVVKMYLGEISIKKEKYNTAISYLEKLIHLPEKDLLYIKLNNILYNIGNCYLQLKDYDKAKKYFEKSFKNEKDTIELIGNFSSIANLYYEQYKDDIAIPYFIKAYDLSNTVKLSSNVSNTYDYEENRIALNEKERTAFNMSVVEENRKNFEKALKYRKESERWKDSLNDQNRIYEVAQKEKEFAVQQKQNEVDILQVKNELQETQRNIFLYSAVGLLIVLGGILYFYREKVKSNRIITEQKETLDELNATKDKLFSIVSHDLRSSVNALKNSNKILVSNLESKNLIALEDLLKKNSTIVNGAYGLLDNLLNWALLQTKQQYFYIEKQRLFIIVEHVSYNYQPLLLEKELSFENTVSKKDVVYADQESLKIVLRNLLDNAIKFSKTNGSIKIYTRKTSEDYCDLVIQDTGLGMSEETRLKLLEDNVLLNKKEHEDVIGTGLGLQLCKSMIKKNNGKFDIESELGKGTKMIVSLPKIPLNG